MMMNREFIREYTNAYSRELALADKYNKNRRDAQTRHYYNEEMNVVIGMRVAAKALGISEDELDELDHKIDSVRAEYDLAVDACNGDVHEIGKVTSDYYDMYPGYIF